MSQVIGFIGALGIGLVLGLLGGGGSILTVPILTYLFEIPAERATSYSLFIVFISSLVGCVSHFIRKNVSLKLSGVFLLPAIVGVSLSRSVILPNIPPSYPKDKIILLVFAAVMLWAAQSMLFPNARRPIVNDTQGSTYGFPLRPAEFRFRVVQHPDGHLLLVAVLGGLAGTIMGFVGAGGGFIIVPVLVSFGKLDMHHAVGSSLFIITASTLVGVFNDISRGVSYDWSFLCLFAGIALVGVFTGVKLSSKISAPNLKKAFGVLIITVSLWVLYRELLGGSN